MKKRSVKIALVQMACNHPAAQNFRKAVSRIETAARTGAQIVCLPELFLSPYFCQAKQDSKAFQAAESIPGPTTKALGEIARKYGIVIVGGSIFEKKGKEYFNTSPILGVDGKLIGVHRKIHIPEDRLFHEQHYFSPGRSGIRTYKTPFGRIAVLICFDQWFPEAARLAALDGAQIIFYPTAIGTIDEKVEKNVTGDWENMWRNVQLGHAAANNIYVAAVNRVGREGNLHFWGGSFVADPSSRLLALAREKEKIIYTDCDLMRVQELQNAWGFIRNRRPNTYRPLIKSV